MERVMAEAIPDSAKIWPPPSFSARSRRVALDVLPHAWFRRLPSVRDDLIGTRPRA